MKTLTIDAIAGGTPAGGLITRGTMQRLTIHVADASSCYLRYAAASGTIQSAASCISGDTGRTSSVIATA